MNMRQINKLLVVNVLLTALVVVGCQGEDAITKCMKARKWVWHPDKAINYSTLDPKSYFRF